jgi:hypothetical protein
VSPEKFFGESVEIAGEIETIYGPGVFRLGAAGVANAKKILVVEKARVREVMGQGDVVVVNGIVRELREPEIEREIGYELDEAVEIDEGGRAVIVANSVEVVEHEETAGDNLGGAR